MFRLSLALLATALLLAEHGAAARPSADGQRILMRWQRRLAAAEIHGGAYASENATLKKLHRDARRYAAAIGKAGGNASARLARDLYLRRPRGKTKNGALRLFYKNLGIISDDLYLASYAQPQSWSQGERQSLARVRAACGPRGVKLETPPDAASRAFDHQAFAVRIVAALPGALGEALRQIHPTELAQLGFPGVIERWSRDPQLWQGLTSFTADLRRLRDRLRANAPPHESVWELALRHSEGQPLRAAELLGIIVGQTKRPLRYVEQVVTPRYPTAGASTAAFGDAARAYFYLGEVHELALANLGKTILYPPGTNLSTPKFWHFYAAMALGWNLQQRGSSASTARHLGTLIASGYEAATLPKNLSLGRGLSFASLGDWLKDGLNDVNTQREGYRAAARLREGAGTVAQP